MKKEKLIAHSFTNGYNTAIEHAIAILEDFDLYKADEDGDLVACKWEVIGDIARLKGGEQE